MNRNSPAVLVIDDDRDLAELIACFLAQANLRPVISSNGVDGLRHAQALLPILILCESCLPGLSGLEVIEALRNDPTTAHIPIVLMSDQGGARFDGSEATTFLLKPFQMNEMVATVQRLVRESEMVSAKNQETGVHEFEHAT